MAERKAKKKRRSSVDMWGRHVPRVYGRESSLCYMRCTALCRVEVDANARVSSLHALFWSLSGPCDNNKHFDQ